MWRHKYSWIIVAVAGVVVHAVNLWMEQDLRGAIDVHAFDSPDSREFFTIAENLVEHGAFSDALDGSLAPNTWRTPGYPLFLAGVRLLFGNSPTAAILAQQLLGVLSAVLLFCIARRFMTDQRAILVALIFLVEPYHLFYSCWLLSATLFVFVLLAAWRVWLWAIDRDGVMPVVVLGGLTGLLVLIRPLALLVPIVVIAGLILHSQKNVKKGTKVANRLRLVRPMAYSLVVVLMVGAWMGRNRAVAGHFALSDQGGVVLAYFKAAEVALWSEGRSADRYLETSTDIKYAGETHVVWDRIDVELQSRFPSLTRQERARMHWGNLAQGNRAPIDSFDVDAALKRIGLAMLLKSPVDTFVYYVIRGASLLAFPLDNALSPPNGIVVDQKTSMGRGLVFSALALWALMSLYYHRRDFLACYFPAACMLALMLVSVPQVDPRLRVPLIPFLVFLALLPPEGAQPKKEPVQSPS